MHKHPRVPKRLAQTAKAVQQRKRSNTGLKRPVGVEVLMPPTQSCGPKTIAREAVL